MRHSRLAAATALTLAALGPSRSEPLVQLVSPTTEITIGMPQQLDLLPTPQELAKSYLFQQGPEYFSIRRSHQLPLACPAATEAQKQVLNLDLDLRIAQNKVDIARDRLHQASPDSDFRKLANDLQHQEEIEHRLSTTIKGFEAKQEHETLKCLWETGRAA